MNVTPTTAALSVRAAPVVTPLALGRALIALLFVVSGLQKAWAFGDVAGWMASLGLPFAPYALAATIALEVSGGLALLAGWRARPIAALLAAFVVAATLVSHAFWAVPAEQFADQLTHFLKNLAIIGGLVLVALPAPRRT